MQRSTKIKVGAGVGLVLAILAAREINIARINSPEYQSEQERRRAAEAASTDLVLAKTDALGAVVDTASKCGDSLAALERDSVVNGLTLENFQSSRTLIAEAKVTCRAAATAANNPLLDPPFNEKAPAMEKMARAMETLDTAVKAKSREERQRLAVEGLALLNEASSEL